STYYPGEACFALARLYVRTGETRWRAAARRGIRYLIEVRDADLDQDELPHDHWLAYALREVRAAAPGDGREEGFAAAPATDLPYARRIAAAISRAQHGGGPVKPAAWRGGFYSPPRTAPTATRLEGLVALVERIADTPSGEGDATTELAPTLCAAAAFLLRVQVVPERALFLPRPSRALGGFPGGLQDRGLRIDTSQHAISALLGLARLLERGELTCRRDRGDTGRPVAPTIHPPTLGRERHPGAETILEPTSARFPGRFRMGRGM
ncbi:MAG: glycoside hydrolase family 127 protein, partial [Holophagales bacterium]|nr:glycoside hydrolase family 127 protein [Holophagales bacterium]